MNTERLIYIRERNGISKTELGKILGVTKHSIYNWEKGFETIPLKHLNTFCNYFHVSMDYVCYLSNDNILYNEIILDKELIGKNIKKIRLDNKLSQRDLGEILKADHTTIGKYERGTNLILTGFLYEICKTFTLSMDELCGKELIKEKRLIES